VVKISTSGELGTGAFQYSLDGGTTYSAAITIPAGATYALAPSGATVTFVPGAGRCGHLVRGRGHVQLRDQRPELPDLELGRGGAGGRWWR
jgi:hypothetical protein